MLTTETKTDIVLNVTRIKELRNSLDENINYFFAKSPSKAYDYAKYQCAEVEKAFHNDIYEYLKISTPYEQALLSCSNVKNEEVELEIIESLLNNGFECAPKTYEETAKNIELLFDEIETAIKKKSLIRLYEIGEMFLCMNLGITMFIIEREENAKD